jgi:hypothetical protein
MCFSVFDNPIEGCLCRDYFQCYDVPLANVRMRRDRAGVDGGAGQYVLGGQCAVERDEPDQY